MEFFLGLVVGFILAAIVGAAGAYLFLRDTRPIPPPAAALAATEPALTVTMIESLLNQQMRETLVAGALEASQTAPGAKARVPFKMKLKEAQLDVQPGSRGKLIAQMTVSMGPVIMDVRPITELYFVVQAGKLRILVSQVQLHGATVPRDWIEATMNELIGPAEAKFNQPLAQVGQEMNVALADVETTDEMLILKFRGRR